ncbi:uncharacterized protein [Spinacia oleracea]|uniref:Uncharacterized protein LOC110775619 n=1 Tax=Spinacia oleracea TaxID=3562 RepID=A0A9R0HS76_SPIOL|nr:uncharacterized protein LOC110775619 isoform X2 [Spinacia oleracea]XP_056684361.1 uncharacterized protein LOC110775619 isoform X2 [Spinacia oleracea]
MKPPQPSDFSNWGLKVSREKPVTISLHPNKRLRICRATLGYGVDKLNKERSLLSVKYRDNNGVYLCSLRLHCCESYALNDVFEGPHDVIFSVKGPGPIHLVGYLYHDCPLPTILNQTIIQDATVKEHILSEKKLKRKRGDTRLPNAADQVDENNGQGHDEYNVKLDDSKKKGIAKDPDDDVCLEAAEGKSCDLGSVSQMYLKKYFPPHSLVSSPTTCQLSSQVEELKMMVEESQKVAAESYKMAKATNEKNEKENEEWRKEKKVWMNERKAMQTKLTELLNVVHNFCRFHGTRGSPSAT